MLDDMGDSRLCLFAFSGILGHSLGFARFK